MVRQTVDTAGKFRNMCLILNDVREKLDHAERFLPDKFPQGEAEVIKLRLSEIVEEIEAIKKRL